MANEHMWNDLGGGLLGNHQISDDLLWASTGMTQLVKHTKPYTGFQKNAGDTVNMYHVLPIPDLQNAELEEEGEVPVRMLAFGHRALTLTEHGTAIKFTHKLELLFKFGIPAVMQEALSKHLAETQDNEVAALGFLNSDIKLVATPSSLSGLTFSTTGTPGAIASYPMTKDHVKKISAYMWDTIHVPFINRGKRKDIGSQDNSDHYVCLSAGSNIESLGNDPDVASWQKSMGAGAMIYRNEQCNLHNIRFVRINRQNAFGDEIGTSEVIGDACFFGDYGVAEVMAEKPTLRINPNWGGKAGLVKAYLWYGVYTYGPYFNYADDGLAKAIRWGSL